MRTLIILAAVIILVMVLRTLYKQSPQKIAQFMRQFGLVLIIGVFVFLLMTGRMHWLFGLVAAAIPFLKRLLPLLRYVPFLHGLYKQHQTARGNARGPTGGQTSSVDAHYVRMTLDHDTGEMDGLILMGSRNGTHLSELTLEQLLSLFPEWQDDEASVSLLQSYLDRMHPDWQSQASGWSRQRQSEASMDSGGMTVDEALQILGLEPGAGEGDITSAHKRLMQKVHPDLGGSTYLAAKINQAKDILLKNV